MNDGPAQLRRQGRINLMQLAARQVRVARVIGIGQQQAQRGRILRGVEIAGDRDQRLRVAIKQIVYFQTQIERLRRPLHGRQQIPLRPHGNVFPDLGR